MSAPARRRSGYFTVEAEVDLEDIASDLEEAGWHHEDDCKYHHGYAPAPSSDSIAGQLAEAVASLHRQAHPSQNPEPAICREEPCRSLPASVLLPTMSSR